MRQDRRRGVTLPEFLVTMFLFAFVLAMIGQLSRQFSGVFRFSAGKERTLQAASVGLETIAREVRGAIAIQAGSGSVLRFDVVNPTQTARLHPTVSPPPTPLVPVNQSSNLSRIEYSSDGENLIRGFRSPPNAAMVTQVVCHGVVGFSCQRLPGNAMAIALSVREDKVIRDLSTETPLLEGVP